MCLQPPRNAVPEPGGHSCSLHSGHGASFDSFLTITILGKKQTHLWGVKERATDMTKEIEEGQ